MIALNVAKLIFFLPESQISLCIKPKRKKSFLCGKFRSIPTFKIREKSRNVFVMSLGLSDLKVLPSSVAADPKITRHWFATLARNNDMSFFLLF